MSRLDELVAEADADPDTVALLLHGSRARGAERPESDYDLFRFLTEDAYARRPKSDLHVKDGDVDTAYASVSRLRELAEKPAWQTSAFVTARLLLDKTGEVTEVLRILAERAAEQAWADVPEAYDDYLNCFVRSLKAWSKGDALGGRLQAADSALRVVRVLFGLDRRWPPYLDRLDPDLSALEHAFEWPEGFLRRALLTLLQSGDVETQIDLADRVEALARSRGIEHEWGDELEQLKRG